MGDVGSVLPGSLAHLDKPAILVIHLSVKEQVIEKGWRGFGIFFFAGEESCFYIQKASDLRSEALKTG
jgi:hypothetical protein